MTGLPCRDRSRKTPERPPRDCTACPRTRRRRKRQLPIRGLAILLDGRAAPMKCRQLTAKQSRQIVPGGSGFNLPRTGEGTFFGCIGWDG